MSFAHVIAKGDPPSPLGAAEAQAPNATGVPRPGGGVDTARTEGPET
eukprot:CAMPEP_0169373824 /NCGR_PEP_ID=MMETSP1017-20121227/37210_1 /TAXON_ID=342587 /ORGANISM="Karlodinium micrum, Strain CCMP2283" /LENGTH=46 /DNA_ID= /DNA_START= /DNA_END= /DNA_ORIENTATION=